MNTIYPEDRKAFASGLTYYWGSLYGSSEALSLIEFAKTHKQVVLYIARDISQSTEILQALNFYNHDLTILSFPNWEVLAFDHFSPHPDIISSRLKTLSQLETLEKGIVITSLESLTQRLCPKNYIAKYSFNLEVGNNLVIETFTNELLRIGYRRASRVMEQC